MSRRRIVVYSNGDDRDKVVETSATTWGELLQEHPDIADMAQGKAATIRDPRTSITGSGTKLPNQDLTIFLTVEKIKAGDNSLAFSSFKDALAKYLASYTVQDTYYCGSLTINFIKNAKNKDKTEGLDKGIKSLSF